jgi:signal peptidase II
VLGGAIGNIIDRVFYGVWFAALNPDTYPNALFYGRVVDMFYFDLWDFRWPDWVPLVGGSQTSTPIFNLADAAISVGIVVILIFQKRLFDIGGVRQKPTPNTPPDAPASPGL